jgi:zinc D-Ala-D-Ala carboxypeptidase
LLSKKVNEKLSAYVSILLCAIFGYGDIATAKDTSATSNDRAIQQSIQRQGFIKIPGIGLIDLNDPIYVGSHFTWGEATRDGSRIPRDTLYRGEWVSGEEIADNITKLARELDKIRFQFGNNPIDINSWYRPPEVNQATDGAAQDSYHLIGLAADFRVCNRDSYKVYSVLNLTWPGGLGRYDGRTHGDLRHLVGDDLARW